MNVSVVIVVCYLFCFTVFHVFPRGNRILGLEASRPSCASSLFQRDQGTPQSKREFPPEKGKRMLLG